MDFLGHKGISILVSEGCNHNLPMNQHEIGLRDYNNIAVKPRLVWLFHFVESERPSIGICCGLDNLFCFFINFEKVLVPFRMRSDQENFSRSDETSKLIDVTIRSFIALDAAELDDFADTE